VPGVNFRDSRPPASAQTLALLGFLALTALAAAGGILTPPGAWYAALVKPPLNPPDWVFPPVWTVLYLLMALAAWLVWRRTGLRGGMPAFAPFIAQLGANGLWSVLFFGLERPLLALIDLAVLWCLIVLTMFRFARVSRRAAALLAPYLAWVTFAGYLNAGIVVLN
jgi:tryptophan-rich sensory protein